MLAGIKIRETYRIPLVNIQGRRAEIKVQHVDEADLRRRCRGRCLSADGDDDRVRESAAHVQICVIRAIAGIGMLFCQGCTVGGVSGIAGMRSRVGGVITKEPGVAKASRNIL